VDTKILVSTVWRKSMRVTNVLMALVLIVPSSALAWGHKGHELTGDVADSLIAGHRAATEVKSLLGVTLAEAAKWPDCAKDVYRTAAGKFAVQNNAQDKASCQAFQSPAAQQEMIQYVTSNWNNCVYVPGKPCASAFHFTDIDERSHDDYNASYFGANSHDIVHALDMAINILVHPERPIPSPFHIPGDARERQRIALFLVAHFVGDLHQPLHVGAVYLSSDGEFHAADEGSGTAGGNSIVFGKQNLHSMWDGIPPCWNVGSTCKSRPDFTTQAKRVPPTPGALSTWPEKWASETVATSKAAFRDLQFATGSSAGRWQASLRSGAPSYAKSRRAIQKPRLIKAGARLAQLLMAVWPG
jgi:hypothetical protein